MSADPTPDALLDSAAAAAALGLEASHVRRLARSRGVGRRVGRDWVFTAADLAALAQRKTTPGPEPGTRRKEAR